jgi:hypothetical protein
MMQCIRCNKSSLFAPRLKALENKRNSNILVKQEESQIFLKWETLIHSYLKLKMNNIANATWIEFELKLYLIELNSNTFNLIQFQFN